MGNCDLDNPKNIVLWNISRIQKTPMGCFNINKLKRRHEIKKHNIDLEEVIKELINDRMMKNGNKKGVYCMTHDGKLKELVLEL